MGTSDYIVFIIYFIVVAGYGWWIYNKKRAKEQTTQDYFLAEGSLTWWAIGASLIASNISAEQMIGMSADGFKMGLGISTYEWMAAATLIVVAVFFMPVYLKNKIWTMPQFLTQRYNPTVSLIMAIFWLALYIFVNLTSILYLGAIAISGVSGLDFTLCMIFLAVFAIIITLGGMNVIGFTDVIQVFFLVIGGLAATYLAITLVSEFYGTDGLAQGFKIMREQHDDHWHMIFQKDSPHYMSLPGIGVLVGGMWIANLNYWGCNQYITQRALGADLDTARKGLLFAAFLKLLMPIIVTLPGIAAYAIYQKGGFQTEMGVGEALRADKAYSAVLSLLPSGLKGLSFAALTAAVVASLAGKANSISTIFTLDIFKKYIGKDADDQKLVGIGRWVIVISMVIAIIAAPFMGIDKEGGFQFIQKTTGLLSPGIFAAFFMGMFWKRTNSAGGLFAIVGGFLISLAMQNNWLGDFSKVPFLDQMGYTFLICAIVMVILGYVLPDEKKGLDIDASMFRTSREFAIGAAVVIGALIFLYSYFW
jgi:solute:Na+ symporter, SSS family